MKWNNIIPVRVKSWGSIYFWLRIADRRKHFVQNTRVNYPQSWPNWGTQKQSFRVTTSKSCDGTSCVQLFCSKWRGGWERLSWFLIVLNMTAKMNRIHSTMQEGSSERRKVNMKLADGQLKKQRLLIGRENGETGPSGDGFANPFRNRGFGFQTRLGKG